jgi:hypothetical protein
MTVDEALQLIAAEPVSNSQWSPAEDDVLRQVYVAYAERSALRLLSERWPALTGRHRSAQALNVHALRTGVSRQRRRVNV